MSFTSSVKRLDRPVPTSLIRAAGGGPRCLHAAQLLLTPSAPRGTRRERVTTLKFIDARPLHSDQGSAPQTSALHSSNCSRSRAAYISARTQCRAFTYSLLLPAASRHAHGSIRSDLFQRIDGERDVLDHGYVESRIAQWCPCQGLRRLR